MSCTRRLVYPRLAVFSPPTTSHPHRPHIYHFAGPAAVTPPIDSTSSSTGGAIPANVLALLQAKSTPSQAALEQKKHDDVESEVERALREAREGIPAPYVSFSQMFLPDLCSS